MTLASGSSDMLTRAGAPTARLASPPALVTRGLRAIAEPLDAVAEAQVFRTALGLNHGLAEVSSALFLRCLRSRPEMTLCVELGELMLGQAAVPFLVVVLQGRSNFPDVRATLGL